METKIRYNSCLKLLSVDWGACGYIYIYIHMWVYVYIHIHTNSLVAQMVKHLPTMCETQVQSLGWEDLLEKEMATHSSILAWRTPWTEKPGGLQFMGSKRVRHNWATSLTLIHLGLMKVIMQSCNSGQVHCFKNLKHINYGTLQHLTQIWSFIHLDPIQI